MKYNVIYADPPWSYSNKFTGTWYRKKDNTMQNSSAIDNYQTMQTSDIMNMKIPSDKDAVLFLWVTVPLIQDGFKVMEAWGFKYKTMITWRKVMSLGMGHWWRGQCEHLLFGVKGNVKAFRMQEPNFIQCKVEKHSQKPIVFHELIERATPHLTNKLELFARREREGWEVFGNEVENSVIL